MGIEAPGKMVEQVDLAVKKEDKASHEVVEAVKKMAMERFDKEREQVVIRSPTLNALMILLTTSSCNAMLKMLTTKATMMMTMPIIILSYSTNCISVLNPPEC